MRALTLKPHWAHAVAHLGKRIENRSRPIPRAHVGTRVAIHAGASLPVAWLDELDAAYPGSTWDRRQEYGYLIPHEMLPGEKASATLVQHRAIVATAVLLGNIDPAEWRAGTYDWTPEWADPEARSWWRLTDVRTLAKPIPCQRGQLGLWTLPDAIAAQLAEVSDGA